MKRASGLDGGSSVASRLDGCPPPGRELHRLVLRSFLRGRVPLFGDLELWAGELGADPGPVLEELAERDLMWLDARAVRVSVAYPFSGAPTRHEVTLARSGVRAFAMCAIDALGVAFMADEPVIVHSTDPSTAESIEVHVSPSGHSTWVPSGAAVVYRGSVAGPSATCRCPHINFVTSPPTSQEHADGAGYAVLEMQTAIERGRRIFGSLLSVT